jgi:hypothetical protein
MISARRSATHRRQVGPEMHERGRDLEVPRTQHLRQRHRRARAGVHGNRANLVDGLVVYSATDATGPSDAIAMSGTMR